MRKLLAAALVMSPAAAGAQTSVQQIAAPTTCGTVCGAASGTVLRSGVLQMTSVTAVNAGTAGFAVLYDAAAIPADGALDPTLIRWCLPIAVTTGLNKDFQTPLQFYYGAAFFISSTSCTAKAAVAYGFVAAQVRQ